MAGWCFVRAQEAEEEWGYNKGGRTMSAGSMQGQSSTRGAGATTDACSWPWPPSWVSSAPLQAGKGVFAGRSGQPALLQAWVDTSVPACLPEMGIATS